MLVSPTGPKHSRAALAAGIACLLVASNGMAEMYRWVDATGRVHYSDQPRAGAAPVELEAAIQVTDQQGAREALGESSNAVERARQKRREIQRWVDREDRKRSTPKSLGPIGQRERFAPGITGDHAPLRENATDRREERCRREYGKSCREIEQWRETAAADCRRRNLSQDCDSEEYLKTRRPKTVQEQADIAEKRAKRRERRDRRSERAIENLRDRGELP